MRIRRIRIFALSLLLGLVFSAFQSTYATAISISTLNFSNLQITPTSGSIQFAGPWEATAFAQARNSQGGFSAQFDSSTGGVAQANASVTFANGHGLANASDLIIGCAASVNIPGCLPREASSIGRGSLFNSFMITGGEGTVDINFSGLLNGTQHVLTDICGELAQSEVIFSLNVEDTFGNVVFSFFFQSLLTIGRSSERERLISLALANTAHLQFDTPYTIFIETDTESRGITSPVPEPSTMVLMLSGLGLVTGYVRKRRPATTARENKKGRFPDE